MRGRLTTGIPPGAYAGTASYAPRRTAIADPRATRPPRSNQDDVPVTTINRVVPVAVWFLRVAGVLFALAVLGQAVLAGMFVTGDVGMLTIHGFNAIVVVVAALLYAVAGIVLARKDRAARRLITLGAVMFLLAFVQIALGGSRVLAVHIPLGVALFAGAAQMVSRAFAYGKERP